MKSYLLVFSLLMRIFRSSCERTAFALKAMSRWHRTAIASTRLVMQRTRTHRKLDRMTVLFFVASIAGRLLGSCRENSRRVGGWYYYYQPLLFLRARDLPVA